LAGCDYPAEPEEWSKLTEIMHRAAFFKWPDMEGWALFARKYIEDGVACPVWVRG